MTVPAPAKPRCWKRTVLLLLGVLLLLSSLAMVAGCYWLIVPFRNLGNPEWLERHTSLAILEEADRYYRHVGRPHHDMGDYVAAFGDKSWVERILKAMQEGRTAYGCSFGHLGESLECLTNQSPGEDAKDWLQWWETNKDKSQGEWILDGFAEMGITLSKEPSLADAPQLLLVLGSTNLNLPERLKWPRRVNAFRFLRDRRFDPRSIRWTDFAEEDRETAWLGLCNYSHLLAQYPPPMWQDAATAYAATPRFAAIAFGTIAGTALLGLGCLFWRRRLGNTRVFSPPSPHGSPASSPPSAR